MTQSNVSHSTSGPEHSAFRSAQFALARKPLPGPRWVWPGVAALAVAGVAYLVAGASGEHAAQRAASSTFAEIAPLEGSNPATVTATPAATEPTPPPAAPSNPLTPPATPATAANELAAAARRAGAEPARPSADAEQAVASASAVTKKKPRGSARRSSRKRSTRTE